MSRYIDADALDKRIYNDIPISVFGSIKKMAAVREIIAEQPTVDAVPIGAVEQIRWERDMAMQQLAEHGIPFGGKADDVVKVVHCIDCKYQSTCGFIWSLPHRKRAEWYCADGERRTNE